VDSKLIQVEDVYDFMIKKIELLSTNEYKHVNDIRRELDYICKIAKLMHAYVDFRKENQELQQAGLPTIRIEDEFAEENWDLIRLFEKCDDL
jgi:hypothetical protein